MQPITYSRQIFSILAFLGSIVFIGGCSFKTLQAVYSDGGESLASLKEEASSSFESTDSAHSEICYTDQEHETHVAEHQDNICDHVDLSNHQCELMIGFCTALNKVQNDLANYIRTPYARGVLTEEEMNKKEAFTGNCMFGLVSVAFNAIAKLQDVSIVLSRFIKRFSDVLVFVSELQADQIVPSQFVQFFSYMLALLDSLYARSVSPEGILEYLTVQLNKAQRAFLKEEIDAKQQANECAICFYSLKGSLIVLPCHSDHVFHDECIRGWISYQVPPPFLPSLCKWCRSLCLKCFYRFNKPSCPLCREKFSPIDLGLIGDYCQAPM